MNGANKSHTILSRSVLSDVSTPAPASKDVSVGRDGTRKAKVFPATCYPVPACFLSLHSVLFYILPKTQSICYGLFAKVQSIEVLTLTASGARELRSYLTITSLKQTKEKAERGKSYLLQQESSFLQFPSERLSEITRREEQDESLRLASEPKAKQLSISLLKSKPVPLSTKPHARCQEGQPAQTIGDRVPKGEREHEQTVGSKEVREKTKRSEKVWRQRRQQQRKRGIRAGWERKEQYIAKLPGSGRVGPPGIKDQPAHSTTMRPSPVIHHRDKMAKEIK
ncbi:hypothetical protein M9H77_24084 [Catharanthus roseus]|uniref:Uncharacterized protein n=1 Tax=Catharanthus roseus TaxID=4058 RepID=A0ACC0AW43_CATRO|nr:hypothetical protein M9H77_24084 [Catharanthus roseus]